MRDYLIERNKVLTIENVFLKKKIELLKNYVENKTIGATKSTLSKILNDRGKIMTIMNIADLDFVDCSVSTLRTYLSRSEFNAFRAERYWLVNGAFKDLLKKVIKRGKRNGRKNI